jgi:hypothetical protein
LRALVAGWFSIEGGGATAGDVLVRDVLCRWLDEQQFEYDVAQEPWLGAGVDWFRVSPTHYSHLLFACGPVGPDLAVRELIGRFAACRRIAINVSVVGDTSWKPFDLALTRDGVGHPRADLALAASAELPPVVALVRINRQLEYPGASPEVAHAAFERLLACHEAAAIEVDTVLDREIPGRRTAGEVQALLARSDVVLTTRLHGLVLALAQGVPAIAVDPIPGGAKVLAQAQALAWPAVLSVDAIDDAELERLFAWCQTSDGHERALACAQIGIGGVEQIRATLAAQF